MGLKRRKTFAIKIFHCFRKLIQNNLISAGIWWMSFKQYFVARNECRRFLSRIKNEQGIFKPNHEVKKYFFLHNRKPQQFFSVDKEFRKFFGFMFYLPASHSTATAIIMPGYLLPHVVFIKSKEVI